VTVSEVSTRDLPTPYETLVRPVEGRPLLESLISVHDFEDVARRTFTAKTYAFYSSAATDLVTQQANIQVWRRLLLRPQILRNVKHVSTRRSILGCDTSAPFFVSPTAMAKLAHPDGELATARACGAENIIHCVGV
jgi:L-lactate dehydrogenase (cytochrome)